jgi:hypothetical protein
MICEYVQSLAEIYIAEMHTFKTIFLACTDDDHERTNRSVHSKTLWLNLGSSRMGLKIHQHNPN